MRRAHLVNDEFKEQLNRKSLKYNWHDAEVTVLEGIMARGDRKISKAIEEQDIVWDVCSIPDREFSQ